MTKPTARAKDHSETSFQELEENLNSSFRVSANEPSQVDLTRLKARAESIPAQAPGAQSWLRPLLTGACAILAVITVQNLDRGEPYKTRTPAAAENVEIRPTEPTNRIVPDSTRSAPAIGAAEEPWDEEALHYLEIGWEEDYELDMLHGIPNVEETALLLTAYETL